MNISTMFLLLRNSSDCCLFAFASLPHMSIRARIVVAVALHEIDNAPNAKTSPKSDNKCFQNAYCGSKKCHDKILSAACAAVRQADKRRSAISRRRIKKPPCIKGGVPTLRKFCGAAVFSCRGVRLLPLCAAPESRGAYHVADIDICDCFDSSFRCPAVLPDGYYSDLREVNSLHSKVFASRKFTKG